MLYKALLIALCAYLAVADYGAEMQQQRAEEPAQQTARFFALLATTTKIKIETA